MTRPITARSVASDHLVAIAVTAVTVADVAAIVEMATEAAEIVVAGVVLATRSLIGVRAAILAHVETERTELDDGVVVLSAPQEGARSVSVGAWLDVGSVHEQPRQAGAAHFLEHLIFKGTPSRSARDIAERFDAVGGDINAFTTKESTCVHARVLPKDLPEAVGTIADLIDNALLRDDDIEAERGVVLEEVSMHEDTPDDLVYDLLSEAMWPTHPIGRRIQGTHDTVLDLSPAEIRGFFAEMYPSARLVVAASGVHEHSELVRGVTEGFRARRQRSRVVPPVAETLVATRTVLTRDVEQAHVVLGVDGLSRSDERRWALGIINAALGGGMSSRLFQEIREERGLAYQVVSGNQGHNKVGIFSVYAGCRTENVSQVVDLIRTITNEVAENGISVEEFERARGHLLGGLLMSFEEPGAMMFHLGRSELLLGSTISPEEVSAKISAVTLEECRQVANQILSPESWSIAVVGPEGVPDLDKLEGAA